MRTWICCSLTLILSLSGFAQAPKASVVTLTPADVAKMVLSQSDQAREINATVGLAELPYHLALGNYDFNLQATGGLTISKYQNPGTATYSSETRAWASQILLQKPFVTGTTVGLELDRNWSNSDLLTTAPTTLSDRYTQNIAGITVTQNLWKNFFGKADRAEVRAAEKTVKAARAGRLVDLQNLVLDGMRAFWRGYVAQQAFQSALNSRDRYSKLVQAVRKKSSYGYTNSGELPQAEAEYENHVQTVKTTSAEYLAAMDALVSLLKLPLGSEIRFKTLEDIPAPPSGNAVPLENLRAVKTQALRKEAAQEAADAANSRYAADVSLIGKAYVSGTDASAAEADRRLTSGDYPQYFVGVRYQYSFGSGLNDEQARNKKLTADLESSRFERVKRETNDQMVNLERQTQVYYNVAVSSKKQRELREKAVTQLTKTYNQGRTDISILIDTMNKHFNSEIDAVRSMGNYQIALNEWAALRDELIPESSAEIPEVKTVLPGTQGVTAPAPTSAPETTKDY